MIVLNLFDKVINNYFFMNLQMFATLLIFDPFFFKILR